MIILKDIPGLTNLETLQELIAIGGDQVTTGYGGFVVNEEIGYEFLRAYLTMLGKIKNDWTPKPEEIRKPEPEETQELEPEPEAVKPRTTRGRKTYDGSLH